MLKYISYISQQSHILKDSDLEALLANCRKNNTENNITGMLISHLGHFIQYIEGDPTQIDRLFHKIKKDPRHHTVIELTSGLISERQFSEWSMAFKKVNEKQAEEILGYEVLEQKKVFADEQEKENHYALELLNSFVNNL